MLANGSGRRRTGVSSDSGWVRSTTSTCPAARAATRFWTASVTRALLGVGRARWNSKRFSSMCRSMWKLLGPTGSTLATRQVSSAPPMAAAAAVRNASRSVTVPPLAIPAAWAMPARSEPVAVAVGNPPTLSRLWLSNTMWVRLRWGVAGQGGEPAQVHQHRAVAVEHHHLALRLGQGDAQAHRGGQPHGVLQVEEVGPVPERVQLDRHRPHDGDDRAAGQLVVDRLQAVDALHASGLPHQVAGEQQGHRGQRRLGQGHAPGHLELDGGRVAQLVGDDPERVQDRPGGPAALPSARGRARPGGRGR